MTWTYLCREDKVSVWAVINASSLGYYCYRIPTSKPWPQLPSLTPSPFSLHSSWCLEVLPFLHQTCHLCPCALSLQHSALRPVPRHRVTPCYSLRCIYHYLNLLHLLVYLLMVCTSGRMASLSQCAQDFPSLNLGVLGSRMRAGSPSPVPAQCPAPSSRSGHTCGINE